MASYTDSGWTDNKQPSWTTVILYVDFHILLWPPTHAHWFIARGLN